jgi:predicted permease
MEMRFALRSLRKNPAFTLLAMLIMALGIGANTAVFSVVNAVLLKPLAYSNPDRIVTLWSLGKKTNSHSQVSAPDFHDWHGQSSSFSAMAYFDAGDTAVSAGSQAEYTEVAEVSPEFFGVFAVHPAEGRFFSSDEQKPGSAAAALVSYSYWQSHFGGRPLVDQTVHSSDRTLPVIGVLPQGFHFPEKTDIWIPINTIIPETPSRSAHNYRVVALLRPNVSLEWAQSEMAAIGTRLEEQYPDSDKGQGVAVTRMRDEMVRDVRVTLYLLLGAVAVVLLIACANISTLLLAKASARTREMAIRAAIGASRARIIRQLISESLVLALVSGAAGILLAYWGSEALVALAPGNVPRLAETGIDAGVLAFTLAICLASSLLFGLAPAIHASRVDLNDALKQGAARAVAGGAAGRTRNVLVVAEVALAVLLLAGAGLLLKSFVALQNVELGFHPEHVLAMEANVPASGLESARHATRFYKDILPQIAALPSVLNAGATYAIPGNVGSWGNYFIDRLPASMDPHGPQAVFSTIGPGTFATLGIPLHRGRDVSDSDTYDAPFTAVINEALAREAFPGQDPTGRMILCGFDSPNPMKIVGVVGDVRQYGPARKPSPEIYMPYEQHPQPSTDLFIVVRTALDPAALTQTLRRKVREHSPDVPLKFTTLEASLSENIAAPRFRTLLLSIFAALAVCLAMAGVYGVMAYVVGQRSNEIGLRMALGASSGDVLRLMLRQGMTLAGIGLVLGLAGAIAASRLLSSMLFEVKPGDPLTYAGVAVLLGLVALSATYLPARRAARVDPLVALRIE